ncbi:FkbM family methyltransferase [Pleurocapsa sp. PCC 7319]|uniref:FkbM family methyltransferase n=1 Tax=Pleurocapsa sp. PCC 7319 TaxID=118161 RepID=UPI000347ED8B|nr:FkbM family methyltransferase [Pleurocapsa sp. PCC 7319]
MKIKSYFNKITQPQVVQIEGIKVKIPSFTSDVIRKAIYGGFYESDELQLIKSKLTQEDVVMEIGGGLGLTSAYCAKQIGNDRVFTFEANPALEPAIKENYALNLVEPQLEICLVGDRSGFRDFYVGNNFWSSSIYNKAKGAKPITVPVISFNEKVRQIDPTFLLLDIEGGEYELVEYADFHNIRKLMIEIHSCLTPEQIQFVNNRLAQSGFHLVEAASSEEFYFER